MPEEEKPAKAVCPINPAWLKGMKAMLPEKVWKESKLAEYDECLA